MTGRRWRTSRGLAIGDRLRKLRRLYPRAPFRRDPFYRFGWWLVVRGTAIGTGARYPGLLATIREGRVTKFTVTYPAGGD